MFEQAFKNVDDILRREGGGVLKYTEQSSWILFLKYLDELEADYKKEAQLKGKEYRPIIEQQYRWSAWAAPKNKEGKIDHNNVLIGDDLIEFVNKKLFPYLKGFKQRAVSSDTIEYKIGQIFSETKNEISSGYNLREIIEIMDALRFQSQKGLNTNQLRAIQEKTLYGKEKDKLAYLIAIMNMILHGIKAPNIIHANTLSENISDIQEKDRYDVVLANPPFGGKERREVQQNFPIRTGETAFLFLQHFIKILKAGGKAGVVIKNTFLSNTDNASVSLRKLLLESCNLHTVLDLPGGTFTGAGVKTVVLFFEKGVPTRKVWFYQLNLDRNLGKTNPLNENDLADFVKLQKTKADSENSWSVDVANVDKTTFDLSVKNPHKKAETELREPGKILDEMKALDEEAAIIIKKIERIL